jgi:hypothetical protein
MGSPLWIIRPSRLRPLGILIHVLGLEPQALHEAQEFRDRLGRPKGCIVLGGPGRDSKKVRDVVLERGAEDCSRSNRAKEDNNSCHVSNCL